MRPLCVVLVAAAVALAGWTPSSAAATKVTRWSPFAADGSLRAGLVSRPAYGGDCFTGSYIVHDAYRCIRGNRLMDPCFEDPQREAQVVCPGSPFARVAVRLRVSGDMDNSASAPPGAPWALRLATGQRCGFLGGATGADPAGRRANFSCSGRQTLLFGDPIRRSSTWRIRLSHSYSGVPQSLVGIREAFIGVG